jgi:hypothetical protein
MPSGLVAGLTKLERVKISRQMDRLVKSLEKNTKYVEKMSRQMESLVKALTGSAVVK